MKCYFCDEVLKITSVESQMLGVENNEPHYHDHNQKGMYLRCHNGHRFQLVGKISCPGCIDLSWMDKIESRLKKPDEKKAKLLKTLKWLEEKAMKIHDFVDNCDNIKILPTTMGVFFAINNLREALEKEIKND